MKEHLGSTGYARELQELSDRIDYFTEPGQVGEEVYYCVTNRIAGYRGLAFFLPAKIVKQLKTKVRIFCDACTIMTKIDLKHDDDWYSNSFICKANPTNLKLLTQLETMSRELENYQQKQHEEKERRKKERFDRSLEVFEKTFGGKPSDFYPENVSFISEDKKSVVYQFVFHKKDAYVGLTHVGKEGLEFDDRRFRVIHVAICESVNVSLDRNRSGVEWVAHCTYFNGPSGGSTLLGSTYGRSYQLDPTDSEGLLNYLIADLFWDFMAEFPIKS